MSIVRPLCALSLVPMLACTSPGRGDVRRAEFIAASRVPGSSQVYLDPQDATGETIIVAVRVRDLANVAGADVVLEYDPSRVVYVSWLPGDLLEEQGQGVVDYDVFEEIPGRLRMLVSRAGGSVSAGTNDPVLVMTRFKVVVVGMTPASFELGSEMSDEQSVALPGVTFFAGSFSGA